jgi:hypothetical protein
MFFPIFSFIPYICPLYVQFIQHFRLLKPNVCWLTAVSFKRFTIAS